jgi:hypothetical protein
MVQVCATFMVADLPWPALTIFVAQSSQPCVLTTCFTMGCVALKVCSATTVFESVHLAQVIATGVVVDWELTATVAA